MVQSSYTLAITAGLVAILSSHITIVNAPVQKSSSNFLIKSNPLAVSQNYTKNIINDLLIPNTGKIQDISSYYHKQMDYSEYRDLFKPSLIKYFDGQDIRYNFCGTMTLLNTLDIISDRLTGSLFGITAPELANKYYVNEYGEVIFTYKNGDLAVNQNGSMNDTAMYWLADMIGKDTNLWHVALLHGSNTSTWTNPVKKSELQALTDNSKYIFDNNGLLIISAGIQQNNRFAYDHWLIVLDMQINSDGTANMLIVDSMGGNEQGFYGWVNSDEYFIPMNNSNDYTGIMNVYGIIPNK